MHSTRTLAALTLCLALGGLAPAHAGDRHRDHGDRATAVAAELGLDAAQTAQVRDIMREQDDKRRAIWKETGDKAAAMEKMRALHEETKTRLAAVLDEAQMARFEERMEKWRGRRDDKRGDRHERAGKRVTEELGLDDAQKEKVQAIFADMHGKREAIFESDADRETKHTQMAALHGEVRGKMEQILTADQMKRFDEMHARHMKRMEGRMQRRHGDRDKRTGDTDAEPTQTP